MLVGEALAQGYSRYRDWCEALLELIAEDVRQEIHNDVESILLFILRDRLSRGADSEATCLNVEKAWPGGTADPNPRIRGDI